MMELILLFISIALVAASGVFVAAEFSLLAVNRNSVENLAKKGDGRARGVLHALRTLSTQLSSAQVGITLTNLIIGYLAEPAIARLIDPALRALGVPVQLTSSIAIALGLIIATVVTMIFGELVPKSIAITKPYKTAAFVQAPLLVFTRVMRLPIRLLNRSANAILHKFGVTPTEELASARSADELLSLVKRSAEHGTLPRETAMIMERSLNFGDLTATDVMVPRLRIRALQQNQPAGDVLRAARETGFSRFPVYRDKLDDVCGVVHVKQVLSLIGVERQDKTIREIMSAPLVVPASVSLEALLDDLRIGGLQMAVVVDEFGAVDGIVTIEDLLEELVGDVKDEHDKMSSRILAIDSMTWDVSGLLRPDEIAGLTEIYLPEDDDVETVAGLVGHHLERIPKVGDAITLNGVDRDGSPIAIQLTVLRMDGRRVDTLRLKCVGRPQKEQTR